MPSFPRPFPPPDWSSDRPPARRVAGPPEPVPTTDPTLLPRRAPTLMTDILEAAHTMMAPAVGLVRALECMPAEIWAVLDARHVQTCDAPESNLEGYREDCVVCQFELMLRTVQKYGSLGGVRQTARESGFLDPAQLFPPVPPATEPAPPTEQFQRPVGDTSSMKVE